jgi:hypothetical protein
MKDGVAENKDDVVHTENDNTDQENGSSCSKATGSDDPNENTPPVPSD